MGNSNSNSNSNIDSKMSEQIISLSKSSDIVVFQDPGCPYCVEAVKVLKGAGQSPKVIDVAYEDRNNLRSITKSGTVPQVFIKGKYVGGCNDGPESWMGIKKIINSGKLGDYLN